MYTCALRELLSSNKSAFSIPASKVGIYLVGKVAISPWATRMDSSRYRRQQIAFEPLISHKQKLFWINTNTDFKRILLFTEKFTNWLGGE